MPQDLLHDVSLAALDEGDNLHFGSTFGAGQRIRLVHPPDEGGPGRQVRRLGLALRGAVAAGLGAVDLDFIVCTLLGSHPAAAIGIPAVVPHQVLALVRDVLSQFGQEVEDVEDLEVAARAGSEVLGRGLGEPATLGLFRPIDGLVSGSN
jgi:hypothetical protein